MSDMLFGYYEELMKAFETLEFAEPLLLYENTNKINLSKYESFNAQQFMELNDRKITNEMIRVKDKRDKATIEQVLDPATRMITYKLMNENVISEMNGTIATGKEANVYHATSKTGIEYAVKIYKTSTLEFKNRHKYLEGEYRFRHGYSGSNTRKMVRLWAAKEMMNLRRLFKADINAPQPVLVRSNVLVMEFIGENGRASPLLKDAKISRSTARVLYRDCIAMMWKMFNVCKLVHADLSEYNILYHYRKLFIIDVSQSVEYYHPYAFEFLRKDCTNITNFFRKKGVVTLTVEELFEFITDAAINEKKFDERLEKLTRKIAFRDFYEMTAQEQIDEETFKNVYTQKKFKEVLNYEHDINEAKQGETGDLAYKKISDILQEDNLSESDYESYSDEDTNANNERKFKSSARPKHESLDSKKARKRAVKEEQAEKRKIKTKKHIKKRRERASRRR